MRHHIGKNLAVLLRERDLLQSDLIRLTGMGQSTVSRIVSDEAAASLEQIQAIAETLKVSPEQLAPSGGPVFNSENQQGGNANSYVVQNGAEALLAAKDEVIASLREQIAAKDMLIARLGTA